MARSSSGIVRQIEPTLAAVAYCLASGICRFSFDACDWEVGNEATTPTVWAQPLMLNFLPSPLFQTTE